MQIKADAKVFRFFDLPSELRLRIYDYLLVPRNDTLDLDPGNYRNIAPRLSCFLVSHRMYEEAYHVFFGSQNQPVRLFPVHGRFFHTKKPLLARLGARQRSAVAVIELRLGPGWSAPPRCWHVGESLGLADCTTLSTLKIFVECDPSDDYFHGFRGEGKTKESYQIFCVDLLRGILQQVPSLHTIELDAPPGVDRNAPLVLALKREIAEGGKKLVMGPLRGWLDEKDGGGLIGLESAMAAIQI